METMVAVLLTDLNGSHSATVAQRTLILFSRHLMISKATEKMTCGNQSLSTFIHLSRCIRTSERTSKKLQQTALLSKKSFYHYSTFVLCLSVLIVCTNAEQGVELPTDCETCVLFTRELEHQLLDSKIAKVYLDLVRHQFLDLGCQLLF